MQAEDLAIPTKLAMASLISGTEIAATVTDELTVEVAALKESTGGKVPGPVHSDGPDLSTVVY